MSAPEKALTVPSPELHTNRRLPSGLNPRNWVRLPAGTVAMTCFEAAWMRLAGAGIPFEPRGHFFVVAALAMRRIIVDCARAASAEKRGGMAVRITLHPNLNAPSAAPFDAVEIERALEKLESIHPRKVRVIECVYFGGLTYEEAALALEISPATLHRELKFVRAWLQREMTSQS